MVLLEATRSLILMRLLRISHTVRHLQMRLVVVKLVPADRAALRREVHTGYSARILNVP
jgi:hypothetical protein